MTLFEIEFWPLFDSDLLPCVTLTMFLLKDAKIKFTNKCIYARGIDVNLIYFRKDIKSFKASYYNSINIKEKSNET